MFPIETAPVETLPPSLQREASRLVKGAATRETPFFIHLLGSPAAGKSSFARALSKNFPNPVPTLIAFDRIMESMPEYKAENDIVKAFSLYELPARAAGYVVLKNLIDKKADILLDHTGSRPDHVEMLKHTKALNYRILVIRIVAEKSTAKERIGKRQALEGRHTPISYVDERDRIITSLIPAYRNVAEFYTEVANDGHSDNPESVFAESCEKIVGIIDLLKSPKSA